MELRLAGGVAEQRHDKGGFVGLNFDDLGHAIRLAGGKQPQQRQKQQIMMQRGGFFSLLDGFLPQPEEGDEQEDGDNDKNPRLLIPGLDEGNGCVAIGKLLRGKLGLNNGVVGATI